MATRKAKAKQDASSVKPWTKGGPSPNPTGRRGKTSKAAAGGAIDLYGASSIGPVPAPTKPAGSDGVAAPGGFLTSSERDPKLIGTQKWITYDNVTLNTAIVASAIGIWTNLGGAAKWRAVPNPHGGGDARKMAELLTEGLLEAQLSTPWRTVAKRQMMKKFRGFALHEAIIRKRADGSIVIADLQDRPQWTVFRWLKPDEQTSWIGIEQLTRMGIRYSIPRERLLYSVENTLTPNPDGVGLLRHVVEAARIREVYQRMEGIAVQTDLGGMPVGRAPLAKLAQDAKNNGAKTETEIKAYIMAATQALSEILANHQKTPNQSLLLDSVPYSTKDAAQTPSAMFEWAFDVVHSSTNVAPVSAAIGRLDREMARVMCAEWLLLGGEDSGGAYGMHADKTAMFALSINSTLQDIADDATRDISARLTALNGYDVDTCTPRIVAEPVVQQNVESACRALLALQQAGLAPNDDARNVLRARLELPPEPAVDPSLMLPRPRPVAPPTSGGSPAPAADQAGEPGNAAADQNQTKPKRRSAA